MLTREALIKARTKEVTLEGGSVIIRALTAAEAFELRGKDLQSAEIFEVIAVSVVDENGAPMLTAEEVGKIAISTLEQIVKSIFSFNSLGQKAVDEAVEELKKTDGLTSN